MATTGKLITAEELFCLPDDHMRHELVRGDLRTMPPAGWEHGIVAIEFGRRIANHVADHRLGLVFGAETGFTIFRNPDTVLAPDVAFIAAARIPLEPPQRAFAEMAPDLVVEVLSPGDSAREVRPKVQDWLDAGVRMIWLAEPRRRTVTEHRPGAEPRVLSGDDQLGGADVVPGFTCRVADLFPEAFGRSPR